MNNKYSLTSCYMFFMGIAVLLTVSCKKDLPDDRLALGADAIFTSTIYSPTLGRNTLFTENFNSGTGSGLPLDFKIINLRRRDGSAAPELTENFPVKVWTKAYTGTEKSLAEIEEKRKIENHPLFEIRKHSGQFLMWANSSASFIRARPDSGYVFDVEVSNSGGRRYFKDFKLIPYRERAFEPSNQDPITGQAQSVGVGMSEIRNMEGEKRGNFISPYDIEAVFNKVNDTGNSLTFKFKDSLNNTMDPALFSTTKWTELVHGFNMKMTPEYVKYDVSYPIPSVEFPTIYTNSSGSRSRAVFRYERVGRGNSLIKAYMALDFSIYERGDWEIIFKFKGERPKFTND
ncbi:DUF5007 domain-containing protein [Pedobacter gandavensis]|uniref:DUF5007 domain-containing protein n=1 Tax=Pedobacter gandavensis TaxID=2679963 RepID=UPI00292F3B98|nr:DUF5007 domain-containing protein [Pedobacter gandavensis]